MFEYNRMPRKYTKRTTIQKARKRFNKYYKENAKGKKFDALYQKKPTRTLQCNFGDEPIDITTQNYDGSDHISEDVQPDECEDGSIKYITTKHGPRTFDIVGVDWFEEGDYIDFAEQESKGYPKMKDEDETEYRVRFADDAYTQSKNKSYTRRRDDEDEEIYEEEIDENSYKSPVELYWKKYNAIQEKLLRINKEDLTEDERRWINRKFFFADDSDDSEEEEEEYDEDGL